MSTTDTAGVITLSATELGPYVTHAETREWLTGLGLPSDSALLGFGTPREQSALRRVAELVDDAEELAAELRDQLVMGALRTVDRDLESIVLDGTTGQGCTTYVHHRNPGLMDLSPLAPSLRALVRPLARISRPGTGLALDLPSRFLDGEFGAGEIVRFEDLDFPSTLTHEPTRRFLREVGLPENGSMFELDRDVPLPTLPEYYADERPGEFTEEELPDGAGRLIRLGALYEDTSLVLDGATGAVLCWSEPDLTLRPLNADISTLAFTVWLLRREKPLDAAGVSGPRPSTRQ